MSSRQNSSSKGKGSSGASQRLQNKTTANSVCYFLDEDEEDWTDQHTQLSPGGVDSKKKGTSLSTPVARKKTDDCPTTRPSEQRRPSEASPSVVQSTQRGKLPSQDEILVEEEITNDTDADEPTVDELVEPEEEADDGTDDENNSAARRVDLEGDDEVLLEDEGLDEDDKADQEDGSSRPTKKQRVQADETAEDWIRRFNETNPVPDSDRDLQRFQSRTRRLVERQIQFARSEDDEPIDEWMKRQRGDREMTRGFRNIFLNMDPQSLADNILSHMPRLTQKTLGQDPKDMDPTSLLALPEVPERFLHRLTYLDIPVQVGTENIISQPSKFACNKLVKGIRPGVRVQSSMESMLYIGSTLGRDGGCDRLQTHERESNRGPGKSLHYSFSGQQGVVPNFRVVGAWSNPYALDTGQDVSQDVERWLPVYLEGLLMVYLGTYHRGNRIRSESLQSLFSEASYELVDKMRDGLQLPDLRLYSLNCAWPLMQGVIGGMITAYRCANPECQRPKGNGETTCAEFVGRTSVLLAVDGPLSDRLCEACYKYTKRYNKMRSRQGLANGHWPRELGNKRNAINTVWLAKGHPRMCLNPDCAIEIPENANLFGFMNAIRCKRCHKHRREFKTEWEQSSGSGAQELGSAAQCSICQETTALGYRWGPEERLCADCNTARCCYGAEGVPPSTPCTVLACANVGCCSTGTKLTAMSFYIEDISSNIWRCLVCDWSYSLFGVEIPEGLAKDPELEGVDGPVPHHRYSATGCVSCYRYATYCEWEFCAGIGYKCGLCAGRRCANDECKKHPAIAANTIMRDDDLDDWFCNACWGSNWQRAKKGMPKQKNFTPQKAPIPSDRRCKNPACDRIAANYKHWWLFELGHRGEEGFTRCMPCHRHWVETGKERVLQHRPEDGPRCCNVCGYIEGPGEEGRWSMDKNNPGKWKCRRCHYFFKKNGRDKAGSELRESAWPRKAPRKVRVSGTSERTHGQDPPVKCANLNCDRTKETHPKAWGFPKGQADDKTQYRCCRCKSYLARTGNEWKQK